MLVLQNLKLVVGMSWAFVRLVRDPLCDLTPVFKLVDGINQPEYISHIERWFVDHGVDAMATRPRRGDVDVEALLKLPTNTLGYAFAMFIRDNDLSVDALPVLDDENSGGYISAHLYETHDIWHVVTGFEPDVAGELGLQAFYLAQFPAKLPLLLFSAASLNTVLYAYGDARRRMNAMVRGWILGRRAKQLFGVDWKHMWSEPLVNVRAQLNVKIDDAFEIVPVETAEPLAA